MWARFWFSAGLFHLLFTVVCVFVLRRWLRRLTSTTSSRTWVSGLGADAGILLSAALLLAGVSSLIGATSGFAFLRLLSQGLFAEMVVLTLALSVLLLTRGPR